MSLHFFQIPSADPEAAQERLDAFCHAHRVIQIERHFVANGSASHWSLCVTVADGPGPLPPGLKRGAGRERGAAGDTRVDYRELLDPPDFEVYSALRVWRKAVAEDQNLPLYAVFSNDQLADMARRRCSTLDELATIDGVGRSRIDRFGRSVLECLKAPQGKAGQSP